jgi:predicted acetyltransferase
VWGPTRENGLAIIETLLTGLGIVTMTPPHLAEPTLTPVTPERTDEYLAAVLRGFHADYKPEHWEPHKAVFEAERNFGFAVDGRWISSTGAYTETMTVPGGSVPVAAVTLVTVSPAYRRRGLLRAMMTHQLNEVAARGDEPVALLWASEHPIYGRYGYGETLARLRLSGPTQTLGFAPEVDFGDGSVGEVERDEFRPVASRLREGWLADRPGALSRPAAWWDVRLHDPEDWRQGASAYRFALHFAADGQPDGYAYFRVKDGGPDGGAEVTVTDVDAANPPAYAALWRFLLSLDLVRSFRRNDAPVDEPLRLLVADRRAISTETTDGTYARIVDVPAALAARRYATEVDLVLGVADALLPANEGSFRVRGGPDGAEVTRTQDQPDVGLGIRELGALYLGGNSPAALRRAGLIGEQTPGALARMAAAFAWDRLPFCNDYF